MVIELVSLLAATGMALLLRDWLKDRADRRRLTERLQRYCGKAER